MADYRIIDADGHVMELDEELRELSDLRTTTSSGTRVILSGPVSPWMAICAPSAKRRLGRWRRWP